MSRRSVRGGIVSLTQTEVMLVLAVVILILLLAKDAELGKVCRSIPGDPCAEILGGEHKSAAAKPRARPPPEAAITEPLVPGGGHTEYPPLGTEISAATNSKSAAGEESAATNARNFADVAPPSSAVSPKTDGENAELRAAADKTESRAADLRATIRILQRHAEDARQMREKIAALRKENAELRAAADAVASAASANAARDKIGFTPCWPRDEKPLHYFAFDIEYADGLFRISPHRDLQSGAAVVRRAQESDLGAAMRGIPRTPVGREQFLRFARDVAAAQKRLYGNSGCRLSASINRDIGGETILFVRDSAGLYPILR